MNNHDAQEWKNVIFLKISAKKAFINSKLIPIKNPNYQDSLMKVDILFSSDYFMVLISPGTTDVSVNLINTKHL